MASAHIPNQPKEVFPIKYMTFNSSCSYAGVANMLEQYGIDTTDRSIAMSMKLPYLFSCKDGVYMAGPMLQSAEWFNLFLHPIGFEMIEKEIPPCQVPEYLKQQNTAMLGLQVSENDKHAVVYIGTQGGKLVFLNNKWEHDPAPAQLTLTEAELLNRIGSSAMVAALVQIAPEPANLHRYMDESIPTIQKNLAEIRDVCSTLKTVGALRSMLNTLFRPLLLDGITMLGLIGKAELANQFSRIQKRFLNALRQEPSTTVVLGEYFPIADLERALDEYIVLIEKNK